VTDARFGDPGSTGGMVRGLALGLGVRVNGGGMGVAGQVECEPDTPAGDMATTPGQGSGGGFGHEPLARDRPQEASPLVAGPTVSASPLIS
jgi:hypothetical protein